MNLVQRGGTIPESRQGVMEVTGNSAAEIAFKIDAFTTKYFVRAISMTMVHVPMVPTSAFVATAEGHAEREADTPGPFQAVVIFEEEIRGAQ